VTRLAPPTKIFQLLDDVDRQYAPPQPTRNRTAATVGLLGADEGYPVAHKGRLFFFFTDALPLDPDDPLRPRDADVLAWTDDVAGSGADSGFDLSFFRDRDDKYEALRVDGHFLCRNDGPSAAFSDGSSLYGLFHQGAYDGRVDPRTVQKDEYGILVVSDDDGRTFRQLFELPSTELVYTQPAIVETSSVGGLTWPDARTLLLFGRRGRLPPVVAAAPLARVADPSTWVWWTGSDAAGAPAWSSSDGDAHRLFCAPVGSICEGNFSLSFLSGMNKWLMIERCRPESDPARDGVTLAYRVADTPLRPWSESALYFSAKDEGGYCGFMHLCCAGDGACARPCCDADVTPRYDAQTDAILGPMDNAFPYAPYVVAPWTRWEPTTRIATVYSLVSTGNPYTPQLLRTQLVPR
jgi:hypothetical protein